eukprot:gb/GFBE01004060.1/.p1 GENE.gb/GFBE01004060.1/~~gb/GFBE01004060.1/.p1  ORF type:complete len:118 (+),score=8.09 gb/GFBE01004060.1/:1-354(+)
MGWGSLGKGRSEDIDFPGGKADTELGLKLGNDLPQFNTIDPLSHMQGLTPFQPVANKCAADGSGQPDACEKMGCKETTSLVYASPALFPESRSSQRAVRFDLHLLFTSMWYVNWMVS